MTLNHTDPEMETAALERLRQLPGFRACGANQYEARCPGHDDRRASLSIGLADGKILLHCHAGCEVDRILQLLGLSTRDLFVSGNGNGHHADPQIIATYDYRNASGELIYQVVRMDPKDFRQRRPDGKGGWTWSVRGVKRIPYNLPELRRADYVWVVEGEKDVETLRTIGLVGTCIAGGANAAWSADIVQYFRRDQHITIIPDRDAPGEQYALHAAQALHGRVASVRILRLEGLPDKGDVSDWLTGRDPEAAAEELSILADAAEEWRPEKATEPQLEAASPHELRVDDFYAYMPMHSYIFVPSRDLWPAASVNARVQAPRDDKGEPLKPTVYLDTYRAVEQMTWAPGEPMIIRDRVIADGGWLDRPGCSCFNLYRAPIIRPGDPDQAGKWIEHVRRIYPTDADHIILWLAHRVQRPQEKINHALVLGGPQGIGKDTLLEPVKAAVGPWNFAEVSPIHLLGRFNGFVKSVILRISEARDLGDVDRYGFYDHLKSYTAAPPDVLRVDEKNIREYSVLNVCGVIVTSNHKTNGIYLPADDRRHYVAWSDVSREEFTAGYWTDLYRWYASGGTNHVAAYLHAVDLSTFDAKAPPPKTEAFWAIVDSNRAPEDAELTDALDRLGNPPAVTLGQIIDIADAAFAEWLQDRRNNRQVPYRMEEAGYTPVRNSTTKDRLWKVGGKRQVIYAKQDMGIRDRIRKER